MLAVFFLSNKNFNNREGGMLTTNNKKLAEFAEVIKIGEEM